MILPFGAKTAMDAAYGKDDLKNVGDRHVGLDWIENTTQLYIRARMGKPADAASIAAMLSTNDPVFGALASQHIAFFAKLIETEQLRPGCMELQTPDFDWVLGAAGLSAFLNEKVTEQWLASPQPNFAARLLERAVAGESVFLKPSDIAKPNARDGVNLFVLGFAYRFAPDSPLVGPLLTRAIEHFVSSHVGYRLKRLIREDPAPVAEMFLRSGMRNIGTFAPQNGEPFSRIATLMDRSDTMPLFPHSPAAMLFQFVPPIIGFSAAERRMLQLAIEGLSDSELAQDLSISPHTLKRLWRSVLDRVVKNAPAILGAGGKSQDMVGVRGQEKRRHLLHYLRDHLQELRPYEFKKNGRG